MGREFVLQRRQEGRENIDHESIGLGQYVADFLIDYSVEDDRSSAIPFGRLVDLLHHGARFFRSIDIRPGELGEGNVLELRQQALAEGFRSDAGTVGNEKSGSFHAPLALRKSR